MQGAWPHAGISSEAVGVVAGRAVLRGGLALPPGMPKGRHLVLPQTAVCLAPLPRPSMGALLLLTTITLQDPILVPLSTATSNTSRIVAMQVHFRVFAVSAEAERRHHPGCSSSVSFALIVASVSELLLSRQC